ncbi:hypothetical protein JXI42_10195 [bacterium]|nr:hypothetical protein [bacterium]
MKFGKKITYVILCFLLLAFIRINPVLGAFDYSYLELASGGMGGGGIAVLEGSRALFGNPAAIGEEGNLEFRLWGSQLWGLKELQRSSFSSMYTTSLGGFGLSFSLFGKSDFYQETNISLLYGRRFFKKFHAGLRANYYKLALPSEYGSQQTFGIDLGLLYQPKPLIAVGLSLNNMNGPKIGGDKLPFVTTLGIGVFPADWTTFSLDVEFDEDFPGSAKIGEEIEIIDNFLIRTGVSVNPIKLHFGAGFIWRNSDIEAAYIIHPDLGGSLFFNFGYELHLNK